MSARPRVALLAATLLLAPIAILAQGSGSPSLLITATELSRSLRDPALVILQVGPRPDYDAGHVPGARFIDMQDFSTPRVEGEKMLELPDEATLRTRLEALGIGNESRIVVIPGEDWGSPATRIVFTLQVAGLGDRTRLLDGGSRGWKAAGLPLSTEVPAAARPGKLTLAQDRSLVVDFAFMKRSVPSTSFKLIDARDPMFYDGPGMSDRNGMKHDAGHIPGARNLTFSTLFDEQVHLLPLDELRQRFAAAGVNPGDPIIAYCHIGQQATMVVFAARLLGHPVRLYDGSFTDWEAQKGPIVNDHPPTPPTP